MKEKKKEKKIRAEKIPSDKNNRNNKYNNEGTATPPIGETPDNFSLRHKKARPKAGP